MRISDWSSDVCSSDLLLAAVRHLPRDARQFDAQGTAEHIADQSAAVEAVGGAAAPAVWRAEQGQRALEQGPDAAVGIDGDDRRVGAGVDRKSTRLNSSH